MDSSNASQQFNIFDIYRQFCDIKPGKGYPCREGENVQSDDLEKVKLSREAMTQLSKIVSSSVCMRVSILDELQKLMACRGFQNTMGDFSEFSNFYDFVFFMCRENGQKNITVSRAIAAWKLALAGRFRLLNQWCDFVEENHRYNISEDTWHQVLAFSRCVHEDLEGYDPEGAWPTLIDDFVEHMYRITGSNDCSSHPLTCHCGDPERESSVFEEPLPGLKELPGFKRKYRDDLQENGLVISDSSPSDVINYIVNFKRKKQQQQRNFMIVGNSSPSNDLCQELPTLKLNSPLHSSKSPCAVEGCLSKGFSGLFSSPRVQN
ncbi:hypothetical protein RND81_03G182200 [Saponaria officinalis]|uniref:Defective in cullin neddylation protein n=1 Tax=Saponaria officinalis TaxID=3572 RepID=A0AAW1M9E7_SAPOF